MSTPLINTGQPTLYSLVFLHVFGVSAYRTSQKPADNSHTSYVLHPWAPSDHEFLRPRQTNKLKHKRKGGAWLENC